MSRSILSIDSKAIEFNVKSLSQFSQKPIIAVVKSDAYGVGVRHIAKILEGIKEVEFFAVACVEEGVELRKLGIKKPILVLGGVLKGEEKAIEEYFLRPVVSHFEHLKALEGVNVPIHVKYDTGMGRLGFLEEIIEDPRVEGVLSHLSSPAEEEFSKKQIERFEKIVRYYRYRNIKYIHLESSAGVIYKVPYTTHIRVGLAIYGEKPLANYPIQLAQALSLKARLTSVKKLPRGYPISYSRTYTLERDALVGVVAFGYADGLMKSLSNKGKLYYKGKPLNIIGNITMDMTMVDLTGTDAKVGDWVEIVGENQSFTDLAKTAGTIPYEIMCNLSKRIKREVL
ncbi:alanine racemase [Thermocrinis sp.]|uniref:alanine racemase n=1 Tax=Thermocrinis sp. TaxID=2024383 RepID=UPI002FDD71F2